MTTWLSISDKPSRVVPYYAYIDCPLVPFNPKEVEGEVMRNRSMDGKTTYAISPDVLSSEYVYWLKQFGATPFKPEVFSTPLDTMKIWHIDQVNPRPNTRMNWVWGSNEHTMEWGELTDPKGLTIGHTQDNFPFSKVDPDYVESKTEVNIMSLQSIIINGGVPHRVGNFSKTDVRWCFSVFPVIDGVRILFNDAVSTVFNSILL